MHSKKVLSDDIKIGAILHLTHNDYANVGQSMREGIEIAVDEQNSKGGIDGKKIKLIIEDDHNNPTDAVTATKKLIETDKVSAVIVSTYGEAMVIGPILEEKKIPLVVLWDSNKEIDDLGDYVFSVGSWTESAGTRMADFAFYDLKIRRLAIISHQTEFSQTITDFFCERFVNHGGSITSIDSLTPDTVDFRTAILKAKETNPDAIYAPIDRNLGMFFRQIAESDYTGYILSSDAVTKEAIDSAAGGADGLYFTTFSAPDNNTSKNLQRQYALKHGKNPDLLVYTGFGYDATLALVAAIQKGGNNPVLIKENLYNINLQGSLGIIDFNEFGSSPKFEGVFHVEDGKEVFIKQ